jgi:hypothetical protein
LIPIDPFASYEMGIWIKSTGADLNNYVGFFLYDENRVQIDRGDKSKEYYNPYWKSTEEDSEHFTYHNGRIMASDTTPTTREKPYMESDGTTARYDWVMPSTARYIAVRWLTCYGSGDGKGVTYYTAPSFRRLGANGFPARCAFSDRNLHSRMPFVPTPTRLKLLRACG